MKSVFTGDYLTLTLKIYNLVKEPAQVNVKNLPYTKKAPAESSASATSPHDQA